MSALHASLHVDEDDRIDSHATVFESDGAFCSFTVNVGGESVGAIAPLSRAADLREALAAALADLDMKLVRYANAGHAIDDELALRIGAKSPSMADLEYTTTVPCDVCGEPMPATEFTVGARHGDCILAEVGR